LNITKGLKLTQKSITLNQIKILALSSLGGILELYDFIIFVHFTKFISVLFFPADIPEWLKLIQVYGLFSIGYFFRPVGGIIFAHFGDKLGRKKIFFSSIILMALPTLAIGLMPTYAEIGYYSVVILLLLRIMQGCAFGGESGTSLVFAFEHVSKRHRGFACALIIASFIGGGILAISVAKFINSHFTYDEIILKAWRYPFILGGLFGVISFILRSQTQETPVFLSIKNKISKNSLPIKDVLTNHRSSVFIGLILYCLYFTGTLVLNVLAPSLLSTLFKISFLTTSELTLVTYIFAIIGNLIFGVLGDRFGMIKVLVLGVFFLSLSSIILYYNLQHSSEYIFLLGGINGFFFGSVGIIPAIVLNYFPSKLRLSGSAFCLNVSNAISSGFGAIIIPFLSTFNVMAPAYYVSSFCIIVIFTAIYLLKKS
jgi:MFS family permease